MNEIIQNILEFVNSALRVNITEFIIQVAATIILVIVFKIFLWDNVTAFLEAREEHLSNELKNAEQAHIEAKNLKSQAKVELSQIRTNAKSIVEDAKIKGEEERRNIIETARDQAKVIVENGETEIQLGYETARNELKDEIVEIASTMAEKIIAKEIDKDKYKDLIDASISGAKE